ncbi:hypothetical protein EJB05_29623, partial [Eragrostis curvula]
MSPLATAIASSPSRSPRFAVSVPLRLPWSIVPSCSCSSVFVGPEADAATHSLSHHAAADAIAQSANDDVSNTSQLQIKKSYYRSLLPVHNKCAKLQSLSYVGGKVCDVKCSARFHTHMLICS